MNKFILILALLISYGLKAQEKTNWLVNIDEAKKQAEEKSQYILVSFSGSDWCGNCIKLGKELFETTDFKEFSNVNLTLLSLDFPAKKANKLSAEQTAHNEALAEKYNKMGAFPLTLIIDSNGRVVGKMKYPCTSAAEYLKSIESLINK